MLARPVCAALLLCAALSGCTSPTLPLPPPQVSSLTLDNGLVRVEGYAEIGSLVFVLNRDAVDRDQDPGTIVSAKEPDGQFAAEVGGQEGDIIVVWSEMDDEQSPTIERAVPPPL